MEEHFTNVEVFQNRLLKIAYYKFPTLKKLFWAVTDIIFQSHIQQHTAS